MSIKLGLMIFAANLALFSCAPKDEKLNKPSSGVTSLAVPNAEQAIKLLFISIDRQVEALHYLKVVLNSDYATSKKMKITDGANSEKIISAPAEKLDIGSYLQSGNVELRATVTLSEDKATVLAVHIEDNSHGAGVIELFGKTNATAPSIMSAKAKAKQIQITADAKNSGFYSVVVDALDEVNSKASGQGASSTFTKFTIAWDGKVESLNKEIPITSALVGHVKYGVTKSIATTTASALTVSLNEKCASLNGTVTLSAKNGQYTDVYNLAVTDSSIVVEGKPGATYTAPACESRPVVDLTHLL